MLVFLRIIYFIAVVMTTTFILSDSVTAQENDNVTTNSIEEDDNKSDMASLVSYKDIEDIAWIMGVRSLSSDDDIDNFLKINECDMYKEFYSNEFEWRNIREIAKDSISIKLNKIPKTLEYVQPIYVKQYDFKRKGFPLDKDYKFAGSSRFHISPDDIKDLKCTKYIKFLDYPSDIVLFSKRPVYLTFIPLDIETAKEFTENVPATLNDDDEYIRPMYIKMNVAFIKYKRKFFNLSAGRMVNEYFGTVNGYEIFLDKYLTRSILKKDLRSKKEIEAAKKNQKQ